jgi:hypothetical protein
METASLSPFWPIEFFLHDVISDTEMITWIVDQVGVLRSVFELVTWNLQEKSNKKATLSKADTMIKITYGKNRFFIGAKKAAGTVINHDKNRKVNAVCVHLNDGTSLMFIRHESQLYCYHFCFEESGDWHVFTENQSEDSSG